MENGLIWVQDDSGIKLLVDNCRKGEKTHVYIEHLIDEPVSLIKNIDAEKATSDVVSTIEETDQTACDADPSEKENVDATEDAEKINSEAVDQPAKKKVNSSDGEETKESEDKFEEVVARYVRKSIRGDSDSDWKPEEEGSDGRDDNDDSELSGFGDLDEDNFSDGDNYVDPTIVQMFENRKKNAN